MSEEVKVVAAPKKTATKKKTATSTKSTTSKTTKPKEKKFELNTLIKCRSVRQNEVFYKSNSGASYVWAGVDDIRELPYQEIVSMRAARSPFLYEPWIIIEDEDLMKKPEFQRDFGDLYALYAELDDPRKFFEQPVDVIKESFMGFQGVLKI